MQRSAEDRRAFLRRLSDLLIPLTHPEDIKYAAACCLGEQLEATRVAYAEDAGDGVHAQVSRNFVDGVPDIEGRHRYADYDAELWHMLSMGRIIVRPDIAADPQLSAAEKAAHLAVQGGSMVCVPLVKGGELFATLFVSDRLPRSWTPEEVTLMRDVAARTWDAVERSRAQAALSLQEERMRRAFDSQTVGILFFRLNGRMLNANAALERMTGYRSAELAAMQWRDLTPTEFRAITERTGNALRETGSAPPYEKQWIRKDGSRMWGLFAPTRLAGEGRDAECVEFIVDISEKKLAEQALRDSERRLRESDRHKDEFLATLAHELRNPMAPLRNGLHILRLSCPKDPQLQRITQMMDRQMEHLVRLVDDLLDVGRISTGKVGLRRARVSLDEVLARSIESAQAAIEAHRHVLHVNTAEPLQVDGDFDRLAQVYSNLLSNAAKYTNDGGHIRIATRREGAEAVVRVSDTGIGIEAGDLEHVFDLFSQVRAHQQRSDGGLGIGLALVQRLVSLHGGKVGVESGGPGQGSCFTVRLPLAPPVAATAGAPVTQPLVEAARPLRILVVDDNVDAAVSLVDLLQLEGHSAKAAHCGRDALATSAGDAFDAVLLDLGMPEMDGFETARQMRLREETEHTEHPLIVALTGWGQEKDRARTREAGFDGHLVKPVDPAQLKNLLRGALDGAGHRPAHRP